MDEGVINIFKMSALSAEARAHTSARIVSGPVFVKQDGKLLFSQQKTQEAYDRMYNIFLKAEKRNDNAK